MVSTNQANSTTVSSHPSSIIITSDTRNNSANGDVTFALGDVLGMFSTPFKIAANSNVSGGVCVSLDTGLFRSIHLGGCAENRRQIPCVIHESERGGDCRRLLGVLLGHLFPNPDRSTRSRVWMAFYLPYWVEKLRRSSTS